MQSIAISFINNSKNKNKSITREKGEFCLTDNTRLSIPKNFIFDICVLFNIAKYIDASILLNFMYQNQIGTRKKADWEYLIQLKSDGVCWTWRGLLYLYIRVFGWRKKRF